MLVAPGKKIQISFYQNAWDSLGNSYYSVSLFGRFQYLFGLIANTSECYILMLCYLFECLFCQTQISHLWKQQYIRKYIGFQKEIYCHVFLNDRILFFIICCYFLLFLSPI